MERTRFRATFLSVVVVLLGLVAPDAYSGIYSWETSYGNWEMASNWSPDRNFPNTIDWMYVNRVGGGTCVFSGADDTVTNVHVQAENTLQHSGDELTIWGNLFVGSGSGTGTYALTGSGATLSPQDVLLGYGSSGIINQSAGECNVADCLSIGSSQSGSVGTYNLSGGSLSVGGHLECGTYLSGTFNQTAGTVTVNGTLYIGQYAGAEGEYNLGGGTLIAPTVIVGNAGNGEFNWTGGTLSGNSMTVGANGTLSVESDVQYAGDLYANDGTI